MSFLSDIKSGSYKLRSVSDQNSPPIQFQLSRGSAREALEQLEHAGSGSRMTSVVMEACGLTEVPSLLSSHPLKLLSLPGNRIGAGLGVLHALGSTLVTLDLSGNLLGAALGERGVFAGLRRLRVLNLSSCGVTDLEPAVGELPSLEELLVGRNPITSLPAGVFAAGALRALHAPGCLIRRLSAAELRPCGRTLRTLSLPGNPLEAEDTALDLSFLEALEELDLSGPPLLTPQPAGVPVDDAVAHLGRTLAYRALLPTLSSREDFARRFDVNNDLRINTEGEVARFNEELLALVPRLALLPLLPRGLKAFSMDATLVAEVDGAGLPESLEGMGFNQCPRLQALPVEVGRLPRIERVDLRECPALRTPPREVASKSSGTIIRYMRSLARGSSLTWRTKLCAVGIGAAGKTSLLAALRSQAFDSQSDSTDGIRMDEWRVPVAPQGAADSLALSVMDFAGQEIYMYTHSLFIGGRSVFVLAWNIRLGWEAGGVEFWLAAIAGRAPSAPVFIVGTHADQVPLSLSSLPVAAIRRRFPQVRGFFGVSSKTGAGIGELREALVAAALAEPYMGEAVPASWAALETMLVALRQPDRATGERRSVASLEEVLQLAKDVDIPDRAEALRALAFLHDLTACVWYGSEPLVADLVVIDPQWLMDAMACLVTAQKKKPGSAEVIRNGIFRTKDAALIWEGYGEPLAAKLLYLTQQFDLTLSMPDLGMSIVPCLLPVDQPPEQEEEAPLTHHHTSFEVFLLPFLPHGLFARAVSRLMGYAGISAGAWRTGLAFVHQGTHRVTVTAEASSIRVAVRGPAPRLALRLVHTVVMGLIEDGYAGLLPSLVILVACDECVDKGCPSPSAFSVRSVRKAHSLGVPVITCADFFHLCSVQALLGAVPPREGSEFIAGLARDTTEAEALADSLRRDVFVSFSHLNSRSSVASGLAPSAAAGAVDPADLERELTKRGFTCFSASASSSFADAALAIANCSVFVPCVSAQYASSQKLKQELAYATTLSRTPKGPRIIPVVVGDGSSSSSSSSSSWQDSEVGLLISGALYISMTDAPRMEELAGRVADRLGRNGSTRRNDPYDLFISYCWSNSEMAVGRKAVGTADPRRIKDHLEAVGVRCWLDVERLGSAGLFEDLQRGLRGAKLVALFVSDQYAKSENCRMELLYALKTLRLPAVVVFVGTTLDFLATETGLLTVTVPDKVNFIGGGGGGPEQLELLVARVKHRLEAAAPAGPAPPALSARIRESKEGLRRAFLARAAAADKAAARELALVPRVVFATGGAEDEDEAAAVLTAACENPVSGWHAPAAEGGAGIRLPLAGVRAVAASLACLATMEPAAVSGPPSLHSAVARPSRSDEGAFRQAQAELAVLLWEQGQTPTGLCRVRMTSGEVMWVCGSCFDEFKLQGRALAYPVPPDARAPTRIQHEAEREGEKEESPDKDSVEAERPPSPKPQPQETKASEATTTTTTKVKTKSCTVS